MKFPLLLTKVSWANFHWNPFWNFIWNPCSWWRETCQMVSRNEVIGCLPANIGPETTRWAWFRAKEGVVLFLRASRVLSLPGHGSCRTETTVGRPRIQELGTQNMRLHSPSRVDTMFTWRTVWRVVNEANSRGKECWTMLNEKTIRRVLNSGEKKIDRF